MCEMEVTIPKARCTGILIELTYSVHLALPGRHSLGILTMCLSEQLGMSTEREGHPPHHNITLEEDQKEFPEGLMESLP